MEKKKISLLTFVLSAFLYPVVGQVEESHQFYTFRQLKNQNGWLESQNAAGLSTYDQEDFTEAFVKAAFEDGRLKNVYDPGCRNDYQLDLKSYRRINQVMFYGRFLFDYDLKKNTEWNSMTNPGNSPLHVADDTPGKNTRETYFIEGGIGIPVWKKLVAGAYFDFTDISTAKKKDIRNKNNYSQYHLSPSLMWNSERLRIGASYCFGSEIEDIEWTSYGDAKQHEVFYFYGLWFGPSENTTAKVTGRRYERFSNKSALQVEYFTPRFRLFNEFLLNSQEQKVYLAVEDERGGENKKITYAYNGQLWLNNPLYKHTLRWRASHDFLKNYENLQQREQVNFIYRYIQYGTLLRYTESNWEGLLSYELFRKRNKNNDWKMNWRLTAEAGYVNRQQQFRTYPNVYRQTINQAFAKAGFEKNLLWKRCMLGLGIEAYFRSGWGDPVVVKEGSTNGYQYRSDLQQREYDYLAADIAGCNAHAKYTWFWEKAYGLSTFARMDYRYDRATASKMKDANRSYFEVTLGLNF